MANEPIPSPDSATPEGDHAQEAAKPSDILYIASDFDDPMDLVMQKDWNALLALAKAASAYKASVRKDQGWCDLPESERLNRMRDSFADFKAVQEALFAAVDALPPDVVKEMEDAKSVDPSFPAVPLARAEMWVHVLRETLKRVKIRLRDKGEHAVIEQLIEATDDYRLGPPSVSEGEYLQVGQELWPIDRAGGKDVIAFKTPRDAHFVFRCDAADLIAAGIPVVSMKNGTPAVVPSKTAPSSAVSAPESGSETDTI